MITIDDATRQAARAASAIYAASVSMRQATTLPVPEIRAYVNRLQALWQQAGAVGRYSAAEIQGAAEQLYGSRVEGLNVLSLMGEAQVLGAAVATAITTEVYDPEEVSADVWVETKGVYVTRNLAGADLTPMHAPLDALIAKLAPLA